MLRYAVKRAHALELAERQVWRCLHASEPALASPYLGPAFFQAVAAVAPSARVVVAYRNHAPVAFFPHHRGPFALGRPIGAHIGDLHGVIAAPGASLPAGELMRAAGLSMLALRHLPAGDPAFGPVARERHAFHVIDLTQGFAAWEASRAAYAKSAMRAIRTRLAKAEAEHGPVSLAFHDPEPASLARLLAWKAQQFAASGQIDVLAVGWVRRLIEGLHRSPTAELAGQLSTLRFGGRIAAVHLGLRSERILHYWFPAYDPELAELSPGNILLYLMAREGAQEGLSAIHLGAGDYRYKLELANCSLPVSAAIVSGPTLAGRIAGRGRAAVRGMSRLLPERLAELPARVLRRLDRELAFRAP
jgi:CelD/BcsL family acetyltransferase involved in cellulose biosynthesis